jgi:hypothetical protein
MMSYVRRFTCIHHLGILSLRVWFVTYIAPFTVLRRLLRLDFSALPLQSQLQIFPLVSPGGMTLLLLYIDDKIIIGDDPKYIAFVKAYLNDQFLMSDLSPLRYFLAIEISSMTHEK